MNRLLVRSAPIETLESILPRLLQNVSLSRAQIAIDQLRGAIQLGRRDRIVLVSAVDEAQPDAIVAAAVAIQQPDVDQEMATVVHAGATFDADDATQLDWMKALRIEFENQLMQRSVRFIQWATDPGEADQSVARWCRGLHFRPVGTLDYLKGDVNLAKLKTTDDLSLEFQRIDLQDTDDYESFVEQVEQTYAQTLDCPDLAGFRTASETLRGYRASSAFDPTGWYRIIERKGSDQTVPVGCLISGLHQPQPSASPPSETSAPSDTSTRSPVLEVVYMGIIPTARGRGLGHVVIAHAMRVADRASAKQIILAVDQKNLPARNIYARAGMTEMLSETVWVRSLN